MKIFTDFHHHALLQSLILLFEKRLEGEVYRPIGLEWYEQGYWAVYDHPDTAKQYLSKDQVYKSIDGTPPLNQIIEQVDGIYLCQDLGKDYPNKAIDFERFKLEKFDILIASLPQHIEPFRKLITLYQPQAKLIFQIGNAWNIDSHQASLLDGVMASARISFQGNINGHNGKPLLMIQYHQEFDLDIFHYESVKPTKKIYSFINCLNIVDIYKKDWELFLELEKLMPEWEFKSFGGQCRDGAIHDSKELADKMREATFIFHCKSKGDGMGHVIHNTAAIGRPLITRQDDYWDKLAQPLIDLKSSILVDHLSPKEIADQIEESLKNNEYKHMGDDIYKHFKEEVDFDAEEQQICTFLENLQ